MTLIDKAEALRIVEEYEVLHDQIAALPARGVGVKPDAAEMLAKEMQAIVAADRWKGRDLNSAPPEKWSHLRPETQQFWIDTAARILAALAAALDPAIAERAKVARLVEAGNGLNGIVEGIQGAMQHGTWRDEKGQRLKDTPEWVAFYNARAALSTTEYTLAPHLQKIVDGAKTAPQWDMQADRLAPTDAAHVNETPKSEPDAGNVLTAAQAPAEDAYVKGETAGQMLERLGMDGVKWAAEFRTTALRLGYSDMDEGWLIGWFCNAIMAGYDRSAEQAREAALHPDAMLPEAIRLIRQEASRDHSQEVVTGLKHIALLLEQLIGEARDD